MKISNRKSSIKRLIFMGLAAALLLSSTACGAVKVNTEKDRKRVVAVVNGENILKGDFLDIYNSQKSYFNITEESEKDAEQKKAINQIKSMILDQMITEKIIAGKAEQAGFVVDEKVKKETKDEILKNLEENLKMNAGETKDKNEDYAKQAKDFFDNYIKSSGISEDKFIEMMARDNQISKFREKTLKDVQANDSDIQKYYNDELKIQKEKPEEVEKATVQLYRPAGYIRVKHVLIGLPEEETNEYRTMLSEGKNKEAQKYLDEKLKNIKPKADEVLSKAKSGENFEKLIEEYSKDTGMDLKEGYVINKDTNFIKEFKDAALKLKSEGEITDPVGGEYGYHIIKLYEKLPEKVFTLDETKSKIKEVVDYQKKDSKWSSLTEEWRKASKIKKYEKRL